MNKFSAAAVLASLPLLAAPASAQDCTRRYLAGGDHIAFGHEVDEDERYSNQLLEDHLRTWGPWCGGIL